MYAAYLVVALVTAAANVFSGLGAVARLGPIGPAMERVGVPRTWLVFPIGTLKLAGAVGLLLGLAGLPLVGTAAAAGLVLYFSCAVYTHLLARDHSAQFGLALGFLALAVASLGLGLAAA